MAESEHDLIMAVGPDKQKRLVPRHYLDNPAFGFTLPPSAKGVREPATTPSNTTVTEPAQPEKNKEA